MQDVSKVVKVKSCEESQKIYCGQTYIMVTTGAGCLKELVERTEEGPAKIRV